MQDQINQLLAQAEEDAVVASDEAMRLMNEFGNDSLLMGFVARANQLKAEIRNLSSRSQALFQQSQSFSRNADIQISLMQANDLRTRAGRFKEVVMEIARND